MVPGAARQSRVGFAPKKNATLPTVFGATLMISEILFQDTASHPQDPVDADRVEFVGEVVSGRPPDLADFLQVLHAKQFLFVGHALLHPVRVFKPILRVDQHATMCDS